MANQSLVISDFTDNKYILGWETRLTLLENICFILILHGMNLSIISDFGKASSKNKETTT